MEEFVSTASKLLDKEHEAEIEENREQSDKSPDGDENCIILEIDGSNSDDDDDKGSSTSPVNSGEVPSTLEEVNSDTEIIIPVEDVPGEPPRKKPRCKPSDLQDKQPDTTILATDRETVSTAEKTCQPPTPMGVGLDVRNLDINRQVISTEMPTQPSPVSMGMNILQFGMTPPTLLANMPQALSALTGNPAGNLFSAIPAHIINVVPDPPYSTHPTTDLMNPAVSLPIPILPHPLMPSASESSLVPPRVINIVPDEVHRAESQQLQQQWRTCTPAGGMETAILNTTGNTKKKTPATKGRPQTQTKKKLKVKELLKTKRSGASFSSVGNIEVKLKPRPSPDEQKNYVSSYPVTKSIFLSTKTNANFPSYKPTLNVAKEKEPESPSNELPQKTIDLTKDTVDKTKTVTNTDSVTTKPKSRPSFKPKNFLQVVFKSPTKNSESRTKSPTTCSDKASSHESEAITKTAKINSSRKKSAVKENLAYSTKRKNDTNSSDRRKSFRQKKNRKFDDCVVIPDKKKNNESEEDSDFGSEFSMDSICHTCFNEEPPIEFEKGFDKNIFDLKWVDCDQCHMWYHWFCVGIYDEDETNYFKCHSCKNKILQENVSARELQRRGLCLLKLRVAEQKTGLYGRTVLTLQPYWEGKELPSHGFTPGDIAGLSLSTAETREDTLATGIITKTSQAAVSIAFDVSHDSLELEDTAQYKITKLANNVTHKRLKDALQSLNSYRSGPSSQLINVLFAVSDPSPPICQETDGVQLNEVEYFNPNLDDSQKEAVRFALSQREVSIIHGPPGTGKTTTVVEIIRQAVKRKLKVLACAPSNIAVDTLLERVVGGGLKKVVRLGHPARLLTAIHAYSLDAILAGSEGTQLVRDVRRDMDKALASLKKTRSYGERQALREDMKHLRKELREREQDATRSILKGAEVVMATLTGAAATGPMKMLDEEHFDLVIIDECSQALEAACWIALLKGPRCILAGDHNQLPPTILSNQAAKEGLAVTLMERLLKLHGDEVMRMLTVQYRMHECIMTWSSEQLYHGKLTAHTSVAKHLLRDLPGLQDTEDTCIPMVLIDTAGCDLVELNLPDEVSKANEGEADIVSFHVNKLIESGLRAEDIAVIAPYNLQVEFLRLRLLPKHPKLEIKSVDGFQGREKEAVVISLVRSNEKGEVGFLAEDRRINVAVTRARRHLAVVCDSETVSHHGFLKTLVEYVTEHGEVRSAQQYIQEGAISSESKRPEFVEQQFVDKETVNKKEKREKSAKKKEKVPSKVKVVDKGVTSHKTPAQHHQKNKDEGEAAEEVDKEKEALNEIIENFLRDKSAQEYSFPASLSARERFLVHELAESFGLLHISSGEDENRHISVKKPQKQEGKKSKQGTSVNTGQSTTRTETPQGQNQTNERQSVGRGKGKKKESEQKSEENSNDTHSKADDRGRNESNETDNSTQGESDPSNTICDKCSKHIPVANFELHELRCHVQSRGAIEKSSTSASGASSCNLVSEKDRVQQIGSKKSKKQKDTRKKSEKAKGEADVEEDFDALIADAIQQNTVCNFTKCKNYTTTLGQHCGFCGKRFCLTHHIPEVHGCGAQAKAQARQTISREGVLYRGSGVPDKKIDPNKRDYLQRKLDKKVGQMSDKRKSKKKE